MTHDNTMTPETARALLVVLRKDLERLKRQEERYKVTPRQLGAIERRIKELEEIAGS